MAGENKQKANFKSSDLNVVALQGKKFESFQCDRKTVTGRTKMLMAYGTYLNSLVSRRMIPPEVHFNNKL